MRICVSSHTDHDIYTLTCISRCFTCKTHSGHLNRASAFDVSPKLQRLAHIPDDPARIEQYTGPLRCTLLPRSSRVSFSKVEQEPRDDDRWQPGHGKNNVSNSQGDGC